MEKKFTNAPFSGGPCGSCQQVAAHRWWLLVLLFLLSAATASAQTIDIKGRVLQANREPLPGVTVLVKGTTNGTNTAKDGTFTLTVPTSGRLVFSFIGFATQEIPIGSATTYSVVLQDESQTLGEAEVIGIGYGEIKRADATGAIGSVNVADLEKAPVTSFEQALGGRVAGVQVASADGQPGDSPNIVIRGNNSVNNSNSPLYVIDGFPIENPNNNAINPSEIASIDVLKDASATAIYGSRGANGVVIITTKRGKKGAPVINYNAYAGFNKVTKRMQMMSAYEFVRLQNEINPTLAAGYFTNGRTLDSYKDVQGVDYQDELFQTAPFQNHYLSLSGGTDQTRYSFSGSVTDQQGALVNSGFRRYQGRLTLDQQVNTKLKVGINVNYASTRQLGTVPREQSSVGLIGGNSADYNLIYSILAFRPVAKSGDTEALENSFLDPDFSSDLAAGASTTNLVNPLYSARNEYNARFGSILTSNLYLNYNFTPDLQLRITGGVNTNGLRQEIFNNSQTRSGSTLTSSGQNYGVNGSIYNSLVSDFSQENALTYTKAINKNNVLTALGVYSMQFNNSRANGYSAIKIPNESLGISGMDEGTITSPVSTSSSYALQSFTGRLNYALYNKYILTGSFRADGSSKFSPKNRWGYFPSAAVAWKLGEENFMKQFRFISSAKLRASYGSVGNNRVGDFAYLSQITSNVNNSGYPFGNTVAQGFYESLLGNPDLKWETTTSFDGGLELGFFNERIALEVDVYNKTTSDLLLNAALPTSTGFGNTFLNVGKTRNRGLEITINTQNVQTQNFSWTTNFNISFNQNRLLELANGQDNIITTTGSGGAPSSNYNLYIARVGQPIAQFYAYAFDGIYQYSDFNQLANGTYVVKDNVPYLGSVTGASSTRLAGTRPGDIKYKDLNGDGVIDAQDQTIIGNPYPIHTGGFSNNFTYKGFDLNIFFQWSYGNDVFNANRWYLEGGSPAALGVNMLASYADRWEPDNPSNTLYRVGGVTTATNGNVNGTRTFSSRTLEDGSFLRLKTVQLGYNLPAALTNRIGVKNLRVYVSAQNLKTWTHYSGFDPEVSTKGYGLTPGYDFSPYPRALVVTGGLNVSL